MNPLLQSPKNAPIPESLVSLNGRPVAPVLSDEEEYCWVFHPSYGFYFIESTSNYHYRLFSGVGKGHPHTEVIPNKLYDDCNRGYTFVDRDKKTVQIQTAGLVKDWLDFVPQKVLDGFKKAFPGYDVYMKGCHLASLKNKVALDAMLEMISDEDCATHQHHSDPDFTTQNGKMMGKGTEVEQGALNDGIPGRLLASQKIATNFPPGYRINTKHCWGEGYKWIWSKQTGAILFNYSNNKHGALCVHAGMCAVNYLDYDDTAKGFLTLDDNVLRVRWGGGPDEDADEAIDATIGEFFDLFPVRDKVDRVDVTANSYNGLYKERPNEGTSILNPLFAKKKCAVEPPHRGEVSRRTNSSIAPQDPIESAIDDATFFKESDGDFEVTRTASGRIVVADAPQNEAEQNEQEQLTQEEIARMKQADTKSYGAGTPNGGTPVAPKPSAANPSPTTPMPNAVPPVQSQNKTPQQLSQDAQTAPTEAGNLTQQQLQQVLQALKSSSAHHLVKYDIADLCDAVGITLDELMRRTPAQRARLLETGYQAMEKKKGRKSGAKSATSLARNLIKSKKVMGYRPAKREGVCEACGTQGKLYIVTGFNKGNEGGHFFVDVCGACLNEGTSRNKQAAVPIKESPTMLPPRDDIRRHIDDTAQAEVMEGVGNNPAPAAPVQPQAPTSKPQAPVAPTAQQELLKQTLASADIGKQWDKLGASMRLGWLKTSNDKFGDDTFYLKPWKDQTDERKVYIASRVKEVTHLDYNHKQAVMIRNATGDKVSALQKVVKILGENGIGSLVVGGVAVQEHGYPRNTVDTDLSVSDFAKAKQVLIQNGYEDRGGIVVFDLENNEEIDLLQAGKSVIMGGYPPMPMPTGVNTTPEFCDLPTLIDLKIGSFLASADAGLPQRRGKDKLDVHELIMNVHPPRNLLNGKTYQPEYEHLWDLLNGPERKSSNHKEALAMLLDDDDDGLIAAYKKRAKKTAIQTEEGVNLVCPACHSTEARKLETDAENGSLVECLACGCFFAV